VSLFICNNGYYWYDDKADFQLHKSDCANIDENYIFWKHYTDELGNEHWIDENFDFHRNDGPAVISFYGAQFWYKHGKLHRLDGPAIISENGNEWCIDGKQINCKDNAEFLRIVKMKELL
jgi:hypothetical protein